MVESKCDFVKSEIILALLKLAREVFLLYRFVDAIYLYAPSELARNVLAKFSLQARLDSRIGTNQSIIPSQHGFSKGNLQERRSSTTR